MTTEITPRMERYLADLRDGEWHEWELSSDTAISQTLAALRKRGLVNCAIQRNKAMAIATDAGLAYLKRVDQDGGSANRNAAPHEAR